jgi:predicted ATPase/transcriptional regulator with XRE-family HTH domain
LCYNNWHQTCHIDQFPPRLYVRVEEIVDINSDLTFGPWLRRCRRARDLTHAELAAAVGCSVSALRKVESDDLRPSRTLAEALADALQIAAADRAAFVRFARAMPGDASAQQPVAIVSQEHPAPAARVSSNLPLSLTALIGREQECAALGHLLRRSDTRLVTLSGPGGIGKTRLGLQVAAELIEDFPDGVYVVELAPIREPTLVSSAIAQTLGLRETGGQPLLTQLKQFLGDKRLLLLLDNFEHLLDAAPLVAELLAGAARLKVLATSREQLHLRGEKEVVVPPLALPDHANLPPLEVLSHYAAVALFRERAIDARADFQLTNATATAVAEICARLDGLPLAIELAAARSKLFAPEALLARLSSRLALLTGGARDLPARQQTIRNTIAWSYDLLTEDEQMLLRRLGVFVGGCTLEAAEAVCGDKPTRRQGDEETEQEQADSLSPERRVSFSVLDGLAALVDKSLLQQVEGPDGVPRFVMLETIREYALERLEASGEAERLRQQHARYYLTLGEARYPDVWFPAWTAHLVPEYDNLWSALAWSQTAAGDPELALRLTGALRILWFRRGLRREAIVALERALDHPLGVGRTVAHAQARFELGQFLAWTSDYAAARVQFEQAVQIAREIDHTWWYAGAVEELGWLAREQGDSATAWARLSESLAICREQGDPLGIAQALNCQAEVAVLDEDPARAEALLAEARAIEQGENADPNLVGWTLLSLGHAAQLRGTYERAAQFHQKSLACFQAFGDQHLGLAWAYHSLGETALGLERPDEGARWLAQGLALSQTLSGRAYMAWCLAGLGSAAALDKEPERAARLWGAAERLRQAIGCRPPPAARATYERAMAAARAQLGEEAFATAWAEGRAMTLEQAIAEAMDDAAEVPLT